MSDTKLITAGDRVRVRSHHRYAGHAGKAIVFHSAKPANCLPDQTWHPCFVQFNGFGIWIDYHDVEMIAEPSA